MRFLSIVLVFLFCSLISLSSFAQAQMKTKRAIEWESLIIPRINPLGMVAANSVSYRLKLYESESSLLKNNFVRLALQPNVSPSWFRPGFRIDLQPLSILKLSLVHEFVFHFGTFGIIQSFDSPDADYSDARLEAGKERGEDYAPIAQQTTFSALIQAKMGPIVIRNDAKILRTDFPLRAGDVAFYDQFLDLLVAGKGWTFVNDADLLFVSDFGLIAGVRYTLTQAYYDNSSRTTHRAGPLMIYKFYDDPDALLSNVSGILLANWWLKHPYRTGQETSQAIPYLGVGVRFSGTLLQK